MNTRILLAVVFSLTLALTACGGDGDVQAPVDPAPPVEAPSD